jgi:hypothetical protein
MSSTIRRCMLAAGAAALISSQAAYAAPTQSRAPAYDPLVSLSLLGTSQSSAAVCSAGVVNCTLPAAGLASQSGATAAAAIAAQGPYYPREPKGMGMVPMLLGLAILIGVSVALLSGGSSGSGNLTPISPQ